MRKFKVKVLSVSGKGGKSYSKDEEVEESCFINNTIEDLVSKNYIEEIIPKPEKNEDDGKVQKTAGKKEVKK